LALWPSRSGGVFPGSIVPIDNQRVSLWRWLSHTMLRRDQIVVVATLRDPSSTTLDASAVFPIGCAARIIAGQRLDDGIRRVIVHGICRVRIVDELAKKTRLAPMTSPYVRIEALVDPDVFEVAPSVERRLRQLAERAFPDSYVLTAMQTVRHAGQLADLIASNLDLDATGQQEILAMLDVRERITRVTEILESRAGYRA
jgi:ATP-dependent Lon protease